MSTVVEQTKASHVRTRILAVTLAVASAIIIWGISVIVGIPLVIVSPLAGTMELTVLIVIASAVLLALAAWAVLALLERFTSRARSIWTIIATVVLVLSVASLAALEAPLDTKIVLAFMHVVPGLILILMLRGRGHDPRP